MYGVPDATFPDPARVFAAAALESSDFGDGFAFDVIDRSADDGGDCVLVSAFRPRKTPFRPPSKDDGTDGAEKDLLRPAIVLPTVVERLAT